jgi:hypothetical protein
MVTISIHTKDLNSDIGWTPDRLRHSESNVGPNVWIRSAFIQRTSIVTSDGHRTPDDSLIF